MKSFSKKQSIGALVILLVSALIMYTIITDSQVGANATNETGLQTDSQANEVMNTQDERNRNVKSEAENSKSNKGTGYEASDTHNDSPGDRYVYVTGAVENPGLYAIREHATVGDVIKGCGGLLPYGAVETLNMADEVSAGTHIHVPFTFTGNPEDLLRKQKVNINTATEKELDALPGIGPSTAKKIVEYRSQNGNFGAVTDIKKIKGVGDGLFKKLADKITV